MRGRSRTGRRGHCLVDLEGLLGRRAWQAAGSSAGYGAEGTCRRKTGSLRPRGTVSLRNRRRRRHCSRIRPQDIPPASCTRIATLSE